MMCTTVLYGGVCHRTSIPHKSGNKMKEKKKKKISDRDRSYRVKLSFIFYFIDV